MLSIKSKTKKMNEEKEKKDLSQIPDTELPPMKEDFRETFQWRIFRIMAEFVEGFQFVADTKKSVTILGGSALSRDNEHYHAARKMGEILAENGFSVVTGGGPGIMEAANRGCYEKGGDSIGINIQLEEGERANKYLKRSIGFHYFFTRKVMLYYASSEYVFFPGGLGTLDEFFEIITLIQTKKIPAGGPVVAVGKSYWEPLFKWMREELCYNYKTIKGENLDIFTLVDTPEEALEIIKNHSIK
jgi:uncharacterized protein (TIGR00730 family)